MTRINEALREIAPEGDEALHEGVEPEAFKIHAVPGIMPAEAMPILELAASAKPAAPEAEFVDDLRFVRSTPYPAIKFINPGLLRIPIRPRSVMEPPAVRPSKRVGRTKPRSKYNL